MNAPHKDHEAVYMTQGQIDLLMNHVNSEDGVIRSFKLWAIGFSLFAGVLGWIFLEKNSDIKQMQGTLIEHSIKLERTLAILEVIVANDRDNRQQFQSHTFPHQGAKPNGNP